MQREANRIKKEREEPKKPLTPDQAGMGLGLSTAEVTSDIRGMSEGLAGINREESEKSQ